MSLREIWLQGFNRLDCLAKYLRYGRYERLARDQVMALQARRFRALLRHALTHSVFYRDLYMSHGITVDDVPDVSITDLPIIDKKTVMAHWDATLCCTGPRKEDVLRFIEDPRFFNSRYAGRYALMHSSGTSGEHGVFIYSAREINLMDVLYTRCLSCGSALKLMPKKTAFIGTVDGHYAGYNTIRRFRKHMARRLPLFRLYPISIDKPLDEIVAALNAIQPHILVIYGAVLTRIAGEQTAGRLHIAPEFIHTIAEAVTDPQVEMARQAFGIRPRRAYGACESLIMAAETRYEDGMYVFNDWNIIETLNERDEPTASNEYGRVVLTNLYNWTQPLIRYRMGDILRIDREPKGKTLPLEVVTGISGREGVFLDLEVGGRRISIHYTFVVNFMLPGLRQIQLIRKGPACLVAQVSLDVPAETIVESIRHKLRGALARYGVDETVALDIEVLDDVPVDPVTGKFRFVVDETCTATTK